jgi:hypothetical protein
MFIVLVAENVWIQRMTSLEEIVGVTYIYYIGALFSSCLIGWLVLFFCLVD